MNFLFQPLTLVTFFPLLGVLILLLLKPEQKNAARWTALITSLITFGISLAVLAQFDQNNPNLQLVINLPWIQVAGFNISYSLGVDGMSILLLLLTTFLTPISIISTWTAVEDRVRDFMLFFLLLEVAASFDASNPLRSIIHTTHLNFATWSRLSPSCCACMHTE